MELCFMRKPYIKCLKLKADTIIHNFQNLLQRLYCDRFWPNVSELETFSFEMSAWERSKLVKGTKVMPANFVHQSALLHLQKFLSLSEMSTIPGVAEQVQKNTHGFHRIPFRYLLNVQTFLVNNLFISFPLLGPQLSVLKKVKMPSRFQLSSSNCLGKATFQFFLGRPTLS